VEKRQRVGLVAHQVQLSIVGGVTCNQDISPVSMAWLGAIPGTPTADMVAKEARVRVVAIDRIGNWGADDSDGTFIIQVGDRQSPAVKVLYQTRASACSLVSECSSNGRAMTM
jgi:hypothetical protein